MLTQITLGCLIKNVVPVTDGFWIQCSKKTSSSEKEVFLFVDKNEKKVTTTIPSCIGCIWDIENQDLYFWDASGIRIANKDISINQSSWLRPNMKSTISEDVIGNGFFMDAVHTWWYHNNQIHVASIDTVNATLIDNYPITISPKSLIESRYGALSIKQELPKIVQQSGSFFIIEENEITITSMQNNQIIQRKMPHPIQEREGWEIGDRRLDDINNDMQTEWMWLEWPEVESWFGNTSTFHMASGEGWKDIYQVSCERSIFDIDTQDIDGDGEREILGLYTDFGLAALSKALLLQTVSLHLTEITKEGCRDILDVSVGISAASDVSTFWDEGELWISHDDVLERVLFEDGSVKNRQEWSGKSRHQLSGYSLWHSEEDSFWLIDKPAK